MTDRDTVPALDPLAPETFDSPHGLYKELRGKCPVAHSDAWGGFWALTRHEDVMRVLSDSQTFITSVQNVVPKLAFTGRRPPLHLDPPDHTPYRLALNPLFREDRIAALEPAVRRGVIDLLDPMIARGHGDICEEFSYRLPAHVFAEFFNVSGEVALAIKQTSVVFNRAVQDADDAKVKETSVALYDIARDILASRRAAPLDPANDMVTALLVARHEGQPLPDGMILGAVRQLLVVGMIAPSVTVGSFVIHLSRDRALQDRLRREPALIPAAIEEMLRLYSPYRGFARTAVCDVKIGGQQIRKGEPIALLFTSANRDEAVFPDADTFDLDRPTRDNLTFGRGPHQCPGAPLARLQLRVALEELLARTTGFVVDGEIKVTRWPEYGPLTAPVRFL